MNSYDVIISIQRSRFNSSYSVHSDEVSRYLAQKVQKNDLAIALTV